jgi:hypothetical protein
MTRRKQGVVLVLAGWFAAALTSCAALTSWDQYVGGSHDASSDGASPEARPAMEAGDTTTPPDSTLPDSTLADGPPDSASADTEIPNPRDSSAMGDSATSGDTLVPPPQDSAPADSTVTMDAAEASTLDAREASAADSAEAAAGTFTVGGTMAGLFSQDSVQLALNGSPQAFGPPAFTFSTPLASGASYAVTVSRNPSSPIAETCTVSMGMGTVPGADVTSVAVTCVANSYTVGGTVTGYAGTGLQLSDGTTSLTVPATDSGTASFTFPALSSGSSYAVTVAAPPTGPAAYCTVTNDSGTIGASNVTGVQVTCVPVPACSPVCTDGAACVVNGDCGSAVCSGTCQPPACAPNCDPGAACGADGDCTSGTCTVPTCM